MTIASKAIIAHDVESAKKIFEEEAKLNEKFPEAEDKVGGLFDFNMEADQDVGDEAKGVSACVSKGCDAKEGDNQIRRRMVFRVNRCVGVVYTFGMDYPEGDTPDVLATVRPAHGEADARHALAHQTRHAREGGVGCQQCWRPTPPLLLRLGARHAFLRQSQRLIGKVSTSWTCRRSS